MVRMTEINRSQLTQDNYLSSVQLFPWHTVYLAIVILKFNSNNQGPEKLYP